MISLADANAQLSDMRSEYGAAAALWAGEEGVRVERHRWVALSRVRSLNYNLIVCHGASDGTLLRASVDEMASARAPGVIMVAGAALGEVHHLVQLDWVCVGAAIFLVRDLADAASLPRDPAVRRLEPAELPVARQIIADRFGLGEKPALIALPPDAASRSGQSVWGGYDDRGEMVSCIAAVERGDYVSTWSFATARAARARGYGHRLMYSVFADCASRRRAALAHIPLHNEPIHRSLGYLELERWQIWSHPRWAFALLPQAPGR